MMKRLKYLFLFVVIAYSIFLVFIRHESYSLSPMAFENIEALANANDSIDCSSKYRGPYCGIFIDVYGNGTKLYYP